MFCSNKESAQKSKLSELHSFVRENANAQNTAARSICLHRLENIRESWQINAKKMIRQSCVFCEIGKRLSHGLKCRLQVQVRGAVGAAERHG